MSLYERKAQSVSEGAERETFMNFLRTPRIHHEKTSLRHPSMSVVITLSRNHAPQKNMSKYKKLQNIVYIDGYNHYNRHRIIPIQFFVNEAEKAALDDLIAVLEVTNISAFIRSQIFKAYNELSPEQRQQLKDVAKWRADND